MFLSKLVRSQCEIDPVSSQFDVEATNMNALLRWDSLAKFVLAWAYNSDYFGWLPSSANKYLPEGLQMLQHALSEEQLSTGKDVAKVLNENISRHESAKRFDTESVTRENGCACESQSKLNGNSVDLSTCSGRVEGDLEEQENKLSAALRARPISTTTATQDSTPAMQILSVDGVPCSREYLKDHADITSLQSSSSVALERRNPQPDDGNALAVLRQKLQACGRDNPVSVLPPLDPATFIPVDEKGDAINSGLRLLIG